MIRRIVKMVFRPEETETFQDIFEQSAPFIRQQQGCLHLELWRDENDARIFFTYSHWESPQDLEAYRNSELFATTWAKTKQLFADKPQAWSLHQLAVHP